MHGFGMLLYYSFFKCQVCFHLNYTSEKTFHTLSLKSSLIDIKLLLFFGLTMK